MIKLINFLNEREVGETELDPKTGIKTTLTNIDPETDKYSWDVSYEVDPQFLYNKLDDLVIYLKKAEEGSELAKFRDILKNLKNKTARVINQKK
jgi:hypothetical protein